MSGGAQKFSVVGHRGAGHLMPENTLASFREAVRLGASEVELDLRLSRDGSVVVIHDARVDRTTSGVGPVAELTQQELSSLDAGGGEGVPTFVEVLDEISAPVQAEIKDPAVVGPLARILRERPHEMERLWLTSFDPEAIRAARQEMPGAQTGIICRDATPELLALALNIGARRILGVMRGLTPSFVATAHDHGLLVDMGAVNSVDALQRAHVLGVDGITTDDLNMLAETGCAPFRHTT